MPTKVRPGVLAFAAIVVLTAAGLGAAAFFKSREHASASGSTGLVGGAYSLVDQDGRAVTDRTYDGRLKLVLFGFTHCPDVCPTGLASMVAALDQLGDKKTQVQPIFISVDPERDTQAALKDYLSSFPGVIGLTGPADAVATAAKAYRVYFQKVSPTGGEVAPGSTDYVVDHTALIYLMGRQGEYLGFFKAGAGPDEIAGSLRPYLG
jgi:protein SCO1/2